MKVIAHTRDFDIDAAFLNFNQGLWKFNLNLRFLFEHRVYNGNLRVDGLVGTREDNYLSGHAQLDYPFKDYLIASLGYDIAKNFSTCALVGGGTCDYLRNDVWLRLTLAY